MNWLWIIAGGLATVGGLAHMIFGERWVLSRVDAVNFEVSPAGDDDTIKRYIRWFWHVGTAVFLITAGTALVIGATDAVPHENTLATFLAIQGATVVAAYGVVVVARPRNFIRVPQGTAIAIVSVLLWLGA